MRTFCIRSVNEGVNAPAHSVAGRSVKVKNPRATSALLHGRSQFVVAKDIADHTLSVLSLTRDPERRYLVHCEMTVRIEYNQKKDKTDDITCMTTWTVPRLFIDQLRSCPEYVCLFT